MHPFLAKYLSYFREIPVATAHSALSGRLEVSWSDGRKVLHSPESNYSFGGLHRVLRQAMKHAAVRQHPPARVLVLGLGAGSAVHILHQEWILPCMITGIEKDPVVLDLARQYFALQEGPQLKILQSEAAAFMNHCQEGYDLVLVDLFIGRHVPEAFSGPVFWDNLQKCCQKGGKVIFNILVFDQPSHAQAERIQNLAAQRFSSTECLSIPGIWENKVIIAAK